MRDLDLKILRLMRTRGHTPAAGARREAARQGGEQRRRLVRRGRRAGRRRQAAPLAPGASAAALGPAAIGLNYGIKLLVKRPRPVLKGLPPLGGAPSSLSFPSAHSTSSFAVATAMTRVDRRAAVAFVPAVAVAAGRPYLGMHYPSDVAVGVVLGTALGLAVPLPPRGAAAAAGRRSVRRVAARGGRRDEGRDRRAAERRQVDPLQRAHLGWRDQIGNYPFTTIEPNVAVAQVPDERLEAVAKTVRSSELVPATIDFHDIAGLVKGASEGEGLGNQFLASIRETDAICHVVRCHEDANVIHPDGRVDPIADIETIETELILSDYEQVERRIPRVGKQVKTGDKAAAAELALAGGGERGAGGGQARALGAGPRGGARRGPQPRRDHLEADPLRRQRRRGNRPRCRRASPPTPTRSTPGRSR